MGAWDVSVFGNDDAADFGYEFDEVNTATEVASVIEEALDTVLRSSGEVDGSDGATGLAAAALVVAWNEPELLARDENYAPGLGHAARTPCLNTLPPRPRQCWTA